MKNLSRNQLRRCNVPPNHRLACSSISQQRCHPRAGHDSSRDRGQGRLTHSQGTQSFKPTQLGLPGLPRTAKPAQSEDQPLHTAALQSLHSPVKKGRTTRDNPKPKMSIAQVHQTTQSFSWPYRGQNNSATTPNPGYISNPTSQSKQWQQSTTHSG